MKKVCIPRYYTSSVKIFLFEINSIKADHHFQFLEWANSNRKLDLINFKKTYLIHVWVTDFISINKNFYLLFVTVLFSTRMSDRESNYGVAPFQPKGDLNEIFNNSWYLDKIDEHHRRSYKKKAEKTINGHC